MNARSPDVPGPNADPRPDFASEWFTELARPALVRAVNTSESRIQAAITAVHVEGVATGSTDWAQIAGLYDALAALDPSAVIRVHRAAAVGFAAGPEAGLRELAPLLELPALRNYQPLYATQADLLRRGGDSAGAATAYRRAIELTGNAVERAELRGRLAELAGDRHALSRTAGCRTTHGLPGKNRD